MNEILIQALLARISRSMTIQQVPYQPIVEMRLVESRQ